LKKFLFIVLLFIAFSESNAQTRRRNFRQHEVGIFVGGSYYLGDLNPVLHFNQTQPAGGFFYRFTPHYRYAFRIGANQGTIMGDDSQSEDSDQRERNLNFKSRIRDFYLISEFNFLDYRISNDKHKFSMFLFAGISAFNFQPMGNLGGENWVQLQPLRTEGQSSGYKLWQMGVPFGVGIKVNVARNVGIGLEWGPRKTFTDYIDDVSATYPDVSKTPPVGELGLVLSNRTRSGMDVTNTQRGNPRTKDWYFFTGLTVNIKINPRMGPCYAYGMD